MSTFYRLGPGVNISDQNEQISVQNVISVWRQVGVSIFPLKSICRASENPGQLDNDLMNSVKSIQPILRYEINRSAILVGLIIERFIE
jgi:hypothetical protein